MIYIQDRGGRRLTSVGLAHARPNCTLTFFLLLLLDCTYTGYFAIIVLIMPRWAEPRGIR